MHHTNIDIVCNSGNQFAKKWPNFHKFAFLLFMTRNDGDLNPNFFKDTMYFVSLQPKATLTQYLLLNARIKTSQNQPPTTNISRKKWGTNPAWNLLSSSIWWNMKQLPFFRGTTYLNRKLWNKRHDFWIQTMGKATLI